MSGIRDKRGTWKWAKRQNTYPGGGNGICIPNWLQIVVVSLNLRSSWKIFLKCEVRVSKAEASVSVTMFKLFFESTEAH